MTDLKLSGDGISLLINYEKFQEHAYQGLENDGILTIGYGHRNPSIRYGDKITLEEAYDLLKEDLERFERSVNSKVDADLKQHEFDALVILSFNIGLGGFENSNLLKELNNGNWSQAEYEWAEWRKSDGEISPGLVARRNDEIELYLKGDYTREYNYYDRISGKIYNFDTDKWEEKCFPAFTLISTAKGERPIIDIQVGDQVWAFDPNVDQGRGGVVLKRVKTLYRNNTSEWVKLSWQEEGEEKELYATPGHHFLDQYGDFPTIEEMLKNGGATVVLASGITAQVTAQRVIYSAATIFNLSSAPTNASTRDHFPFFFSASAASPSSASSSISSSTFAISSSSSSMRASLLS